jgi:RNA-directed DNA polymerase
LEAIGYLVNTSKHIKNSRLAMFRISKYSSVKGISYLSGNFVPVKEYHCHHIKPREKGGTHDFGNLCVLSEAEHMILHSKAPQQLCLMYPSKIKRIKALIDAL